MSNGTGNNGSSQPKDIPYSPPQGPTSLGNRGPGLGGNNHGNNGTQGRH